MRKQIVRALVYYAIGRQTVELARMVRDWLEADRAETERALWLVSIAPDIPHAFAPLAGAELDCEQCKRPERHPVHLLPEPRPE